MSPKIYGNRWRVIESAGEGGQSWVYFVADTSPGATNDDEFVLKRLKNKKRLERFKREIEAIQKLDHPNIIKIIDHDTTGSDPYFVMERHHGGSLDDWTRLRKPNPGAAIDIFIDICRGLAEAHRHGIVHRDIKPENILLRTLEGPAVISDFGICYIEEGERHTLTEEAVGPRLYMAPELEDGRAGEVEATCDVYSLGKVLYFLLSGGKIFSRERHRESKYDLVEMTGDDSLAHAMTLLDSMINEQPRARLKNADAVLTEIQRIGPLVVGGYRPINPRGGQRCMFCGEGRYALIVDGSVGSIRSFFQAAYAGEDWRILACDQCGHLQYFRIERAKKQKLWRSGS